MPRLVGCSVALAIESGECPGIAWREANAISFANNSFNERQRAGGSQTACSSNAEATHGVRVVMTGYDSTARLVAECSAINPCAELDAWRCMLLQAMLHVFSRNR